MSEVEEKSSAQPVAEEATAQQESDSAAEPVVAHPELEREQVLESTLDQVGAEPEHHPLGEAGEAAEEQTENVRFDSPSTENESEDAEREIPPVAEEDDVLIAEAVSEPAAPGQDDSAILKAVIEAAIYITDEPLTLEQIATALGQPQDLVREKLTELVAEYAAPERGLVIREIAGGFKMATKPELHDSIRQFVRGLQAPLKLSNAALETLAVIAYRQPITAPEIMDARGVQGVGVLKTLLDRKLIAAAGRKNVLGKPMLYKTTREFLIQFGLNSLAELPTLKEFEELGRLALSEETPVEAEDAVQQPSPAEESKQDENA